VDLRTRRVRCHRARRLLSLSTSGMACSNISPLPTVGAMCGSVFVILPTLMHYICGNHLEQKLHI
jgi:hypothetical protein